MLVAARDLLKAAFQELSAAPEQKEVAARISAKSDDLASRHLGHKPTVTSTARQAQGATRAEILRQQISIQHQIDDVEARLLRYHISEEALLQAQVQLEMEFKQAMDSYDAELGAVRQRMQDFTSKQLDLQSKLLCFKLQEEQPKEELVSDEEENFDGGEVPEADRYWHQQHQQGWQSANSDVDFADTDRSDCERGSKAPDQSWMQVARRLSLIHI